MGWTDTGVCLTYPGSADSSAEPRFVHTLEAMGVDCAWIFGYRAAQSRDFTCENDNVLDVAAANPGRLVPIVLLDPNQAARDIDRLIERGAKGVKILTGSGERWTPERIRRVLAPVARRVAESHLHLSVALEGNIPSRGGGVYVPLMIREACPDVVLVLDHCWSQYAWLDYLAVAEEDSELWLTLYDLPPRLINEIVNRVGITRCVLGSWYPEHDPRLLIDRIKSALNANGRTLASTFSLNAQRLLEGERPRVLSASRRAAAA
jgi:predicted TIM-barrel fold metal-dependent hydrolase